MELTAIQKDYENCPDFPSSYIRPQPSSIEDLGVPKGFLAELALEACLLFGCLRLKKPGRPDEGESRDHH